MQTVEVETTAEQGSKMGLSKKEFGKIAEILGRAPNHLEGSIFSLLWSERSSNKRYGHWLKNLAHETNRISALDCMRNGGILDLDSSQGCVVTFESSYYSESPCTDYPPLELLARGARAIVTMTSLHLGDSNRQSGSKLLKDVFDSYGAPKEEAGVPIVIGELVFHPGPNHHEEKHSMSIGFVNKEKAVFPTAVGTGNPVFLISFKKDKENLPADQIRSSAIMADCRQDLATGKSDVKQLAEAILDSANTGAIVGLDFIGTGGLALSITEMCSNAGSGMSVHLDRIPALEFPNVVISECSPDFVAVAEKDEVHQFVDLCKKWGLSFTEIGVVTDSGNLEFLNNGEIVAQMPVSALINVPVDDLAISQPDYSPKPAAFKLRDIPVPKNLVTAARKLFDSPNLLGRHWVLSLRRNNSDSDNQLPNEPADASFFSDPEEDRLLAVSISCNNTYAGADPLVGGMISVCEAARNIHCSGAVPVALSNCFEVGDPDNAEAHFQFVNTVKGIGEACRKFDIPVIGNHLYYSDQTGEKQTSKRSTATIGMLGIVAEATHLTTLNFKAEDDLIYMLGNIYNDLGSSEYLRVVHNMVHSPAPHFDLQEESDVNQHTLNLIRSGIVRSAHNVSKGGLFACLMESAIAGGYGFNIETVETFRKDCFLFGESQSRVVLTLSPENEDAFQNYLISRNVSFTKLGEVLGQEVIIDEITFGSISEWKALYDDSFAQLMNH